MADLTASVTITDTCGCCGGSPPASCVCTLDFYNYQNPPFPGSPPNRFADAADAASYLAAYTLNCMSVATSASGATTVDSATFDGTTFVTQFTGTGIITGRPIAQGAAQFVGALGDVLHIAYSSYSTVGGDPDSGYLPNLAASDCLGSPLSPSGSGTDYIEYTFPATGIILVAMDFLGYDGGTSVTVEYTVTSSGVLLVSPVRAIWNDSGTSRYLEACSKLKLPVPTKPFSGDWDMTVWYAACADASTALGAAQNPQTSNCVGACLYDPSSTLSAFVATDGGTSLTMTATDSIAYSGSPGPAVAFYGCVNLVGGDTLSVAWSLTDDGGDAGDDGVNLYVLDAASGEVVNSQTDLGLSGTLTMAVPYTGAFIVVVQIYGKYFEILPPTGIDASAVITSSGTLSVNPIQAQYDVGLVCPGRLNCGDACP